jgi:hypothetical protein
MMSAVKPPQVAINGQKPSARHTGRFDGQGKTTTGAEGEGKIKIAVFQLPIPRLS